LMAFASRITHHERSESRIRAGVAMQFGLIYDFRNPARWQRPGAELYAEQIEQIVYAEQLGFDSVWITEHHFIEDGYTPSVLPIAAAIAARTNRIRIGTWVLLLPLHNAIRVAEDAATVDIISNGRLDLGMGLGYRIEEFEAFGVDRRQRGRLMDEGVELIRRAWTEERVSFSGRFYNVQELQVTPKPVQRPYPPIWLGARGEVSARRAARFRAPLLLVGPADVYEAYAAALRAEGVDPTGMPVLGSFGCVVTDDPERTWAEMREHVHYTRTLYGDWYREAGDLPTDAAGIGRGVADPDDLRAGFRIGTAGEVIAAIEAWRQRVPYTHLIVTANPAGMRTAQTTPWLERFAREVMPHFNGASAMRGSLPGAHT
ncbi:MAG: LLM class flavin-dependent oxidoreductase, partial [Dehalococcoidia bacterium]